MEDPTKDFPKDYKDPTSTVTTLLQEINQININMANQQHTINVFSQHVGLEPKIVDQGNE